MNHPTYMKRTKIPRGSLWQFITHEHMSEMTGEDIDESIFEQFVDEVCEEFCDEVSRIAKKHWRAWV